MRLSTRFRYAARAMTELATVYPDATVSIKELAHHQQVSAKYLEHIFAVLRSSDLIVAVRGMQGGYGLARPPSEITLLDIFEAIEGKFVLVDCINSKNTCTMIATCPTRDTWSEIRDAVVAILNRTTIHDLMERLLRKKGQFVLTFEI